MRIFQQGRDYPTLNQLGTQFPPYRPTILRNSIYINDNHQFYYTCSTDGELIKTDIKGFLRPADALETRAQIVRLHLTSYLEAIHGDAVEWGQRLIENHQTFALAFIDHCHSYEVTGIACQ